MNVEEIKLRRLLGQHLLHPAPYQTVVRDLCGVQAQFLSNALHALRIRSDDFDEVNPCGLMKNWTLRGTMHLFEETDLPLMLHRDRENVLRSCDTFEEDEWISAERKRFFAGLIVESVRNGEGGREALKQICLDAGMSEKEAQSVFNPWGGLIRALCETGVITHAVSEKKAFLPCPPFEPMEQEAAELELARRYFAHYGPATLRDAAYFFGCRQTMVKRWLDRLPVISVACEGKTYFCMEDAAGMDEEMPPCIFLAGFDPLMLGYEKKENPFLPQEYLREIFSLSGIVMPAVLVHGRVVGKWKKKGRRLELTMFEPVAPRMRETIADEVRRLLNGLARIDGI